MVVCGWCSEQQRETIDNEGREMRERGRGDSWFVRSSRISALEGLCGGGCWTMGLCRR